MNTLHVFGDSYTENYKDAILKFQDAGNTYQQFKDYRGGNLPDNWSEIVANKLNFNLNNYGWGGAGNDEIFDRVCEHSHDFKKGDVVIVGWSFHNRFRWSYFNEHLKRDVWTHVLPSSYTDVVSEQTTDEIILNRDSVLYRNQIENFENILITLSNSIGFECYFWTFDEYFFNPKYKKNHICVNGTESLIGEILKLGGLQIVEETNGIVKDSHWGESGQTIMGDIFYRSIRKEIT